MSLVGIRSDLDTSRAAGAAAALRTTIAVRERAQYLLNRARAGDSLWFSVHDDSLPAAAAEVADVTRARYPDLHIPYHSRWRHFDAGGVHRKAELDTRLAAEDTPARARAMICSASCPSGANRLLSLLLISGRNQVPSYGSMACVAWKDATTCR